MPSPRGEVHARAPQVRLTDSVILQETDSAFVGSPGTSFAVDEQGVLYIPDRSTDRVLRFRPDGVLDGIIGRRGAGPGELRGIGAAIDASNGVLAVHGYQSLSVSLFASADGRFLGALRQRGYLTSLRVTDSIVWHGTMDMGTGLSVGSVAQDSFRLGSGATELIATVGEVPEAFRRYPGLDVFNNVVVLPRGDLLLVGYGGTNELVLSGLDGAGRARLNLPVGQRRGVPPAQLERYFRSRNFPPALTFAAISSLAGLWPAAGGRVLVYHRDLEEDDPSARNSQTIGRAYVSVLSAGLDSACVDGEVPYPLPIYPRLAVHQDTILQLDQYLVPGSRSRVQTVVRKYVVNTSACEWLPIPR